MAKRLLVVAGLSLVLGCSLPAQPSVQAKAGLKNEDGQVVGSATFRDAAGGVIVNVDLKGLSAGLHAVHVHEVDECEGPACTRPGGLRRDRGREVRKFDRLRAKGSEAGSFLSRAGLRPV